MIDIDATRTRPIAVIGAGTLGRQIAAMLSAHGALVALHDVDERALRIAEIAVRDATRSIETPVETRRGDVTFTTDLRAALSDAWLVIEAVPERIDLKRRLFAQLDELAEEDAILATNSSSFKCSLLADCVSRPQALLNMHFYNPVWVRPAVELMSSGSTDPAIIALVLQVLAGYGLQPFVVRQESTGFIYNRIWAAIKREALMVVAEGVATPEEVDRIFRIVTRSDVGPFELMDAIGLDVVLDIEEHYADEREGIPQSPRELLRRMVAAGKLGVKTGEGFYGHTGDTEDA